MLIAIYQLGLLNCMAPRFFPLLFGLFLWSLIALLCPIKSVAQSTRISGKVLDFNTREPLPFINIVFKNTTIGTTSDFEGNYVIATETPTDSLKFSYIGYETTTIKIKKGISVVLMVFGVVLIVQGWFPKEKEMVKNAFEHIKKE